MLLHPAQSKTAVHHILMVSSLLHPYECKNVALLQHTGSEATCKALLLDVAVNGGFRLLHCSDSMPVAAWLICFHHTTAAQA